MAVWVETEGLYAVPVAEAEPTLSEMEPVGPPAEPEADPLPLDAPIAPAPLKADPVAVAAPLATVTHGGMKAL